MKRSGRMKLLSILTAATLVFGVLPGTVLAAEPGEDSEQPGDVVAYSAVEEEQDETKAEDVQDEAADEVEEAVEEAEDSEEEQTEEADTGRKDGNISVLSESEKETESEPEKDEEESETDEDVVIDDIMMLAKYLDDYFVTNLTLRESYTAEGGQEYDAYGFTPTSDGIYYADVSGDDVSTVYLFYYDAYDGYPEYDYYLYIEGGDYGTPFVYLNAGEQYYIVIQNSGSYSGYSIIMEGIASGEYQVEAGTDGSAKEYDLTGGSMHEDAWGEAFCTFVPDAAGDYTFTVSTGNSLSVMWENPYYNDPTQYYYEPSRNTTDTLTLTLSAGTTYYLCIWPNSGTLSGTLSVSFDYEYPMVELEFDETYEMTNPNPMYSDSCADVYVVTPDVDGMYWIEADGDVSIGIYYPWSNSSGWQSQTIDNMEYIGLIESVTYYVVVWRYGDNGQTYDPDSFEGYSILWTGIRAGDNPITLDTETAVTETRIDDWDGTEYWWGMYSFTPEVSGLYTFSSDAGTYYITDAYQVNHYDIRPTYYLRGGAEGSITFYMTAGETYFLDVYALGSGNVNVLLTSAGADMIQFFAYTGDKTSAGSGDTISYTMDTQVTLPQYVQLSAPMDQQDAREEAPEDFTITFHDTLDDGLEFDPESVEVTMYYDDGENKDIYNLTDLNGSGNADGNTLYTVTTDCSDDCSFEVTIDLTELYWTQDNDGYYLFGDFEWTLPYTTFEVKYDAVLNSDADHNDGTAVPGEYDSTAYVSTFCTDNNYEPEWWYSEEFTDVSDPETVAVDTYGLVIYKYDSDTWPTETIAEKPSWIPNETVPLEGAEFELYDADGNLLGTLVTDSDGCAYSTSMVLDGETVSMTFADGTQLFIKETKAPNGYELDEGWAEGYEFEIEAQYAEADYWYWGTVGDEKSPVYGNFDINKVDEQGNTISGAEFILGAYANYSAPQIQSNIETYAVTDDGKYEYYYFKLDYDSDSGTYVWDENYWYDTRDESTVMTTGTDGTLNISNLMTTSMLGGIYFLIETKAPDGYELIEDPIVFTVADDGTIQIAVSNDQSSMNDDGTVMTVIDEETPQPNLIVEKTAKVDENYEAKLGDVINYEIAVTNDGNVTLKNITVTDDLTGDTWTIAELEPDASETFTTTYEVTEEDILAGEVANVATAMAPNPNYDPDDPDSPENIEGEDDEEVETEDPNGHLTVTKTVDSEPANGETYVLNEEIAWKVSVKNDGNLTITDIVVTDEKTGDSWEVGTLAPGEESDVFSTSHTVTEEDIDNGFVENVATATGTSPDPENPDDPVEPGKDEEPTETNHPSLFVEKTAKVEEGHEAVLGEEITYEITVINNGNKTLTDITVKDDLTGNTWTISELAPNDSKTFTTTYVVTEDDIVAGHVANVATATAPNPNYDPDDPDSPETVDDEDEEDVKIEDPNGHLTVTKEVDSEPENGVAYAEGEEIIWKVTVINDGNLTITDITVTDALTGDVWTIDSLAPGEESEVFTATYTVTEDDLENGSVLNVATAEGTSPDPEEPEAPVTPGEDEEPSYHYFALDEEIVPHNDDEEDPDSWVKRESVNEYDAIEIEMSTTLPKVDGSVLAEGDFSMTFHNQLDTALVLDELESDFKVDIGGQPIDEKYYEIDVIQANSLLQFFNITDGCAFHVNVDLSALYNDGVIDDEDLGTSDIRVFFYVDLETTDVNSSYVSKAWYDLLSEGEVVYTSEPSTVAVYTFEILIDKYDEETDEPLADATFGLYYDEDCENAVSRNGEDYTVTSDEDGQAMFVGIAEGPYYLKELEAPEGYDLIEDPVPVTLEGADEDEEIEHIVEVSIGNTPSEDERNNPKDPEKTADVDAGASVKVGEEINYTISYYNNNDDTATVTIKDALDEGVDYVSSDPEGEYDADTHTVVWNISAEAYEEGSVQLTVKANENAADSELKNTASVQINDEPAADTNTVEIPVEPETTPEPEEPRTPQKSADVSAGASVTEGEEITYTIDYYNDQDDPADILITDALDSGLDFVSATDGGNYDADTHTVTWTIADAASHTEGSVTVTVKVNETAVKEGKITNTASVKIGDGDAAESNTVEISVTEKSVGTTGTGGNGGTGTTKTGDTNNLGVWLALLIAAMACALVGFRLKKEISSQ